MLIIASGGGGVLVLVVVVACLPPGGCLAGRSESYAFSYVFFYVLLSSSCLLYLVCSTSTSESIITLRPMAELMLIDYKFLTLHSHQICSQKY